MYPALTHPHKQHRFLLDLLAGPWSDPDLALVLLGGRGLAEDDVAASIAALELGPRVIRPGRVAGADRDGLIAGAEALVFPSEYEGFGAPGARGDGARHAGHVQRPRRPARRSPATPRSCGRSSSTRGRARSTRSIATRWPRRAGRARRAFSTAASGAALAAAYRLCLDVVPRQRKRSSVPDSDRVDRCGLVVIGPHVEPDTAPTGRVLSRIVAELAARGHELHVVAALPWYRRHAIEPGWTGRLVRRETTPWGTIRRVHPFPGDDKRDLRRRAAGFAGFSLLAAWAGVAAGGRFRRVDAVIAMSPPLTLGLTGRLVAWTHRAPLVFNIQDVFPDAAVETGAITNRHVIRVASWLERRQLPRRRRRHRAVRRPARQRRRQGAAAGAPAPCTPSRTSSTPTRIVPADRMTPYRRELGIGAEPVLLYAGNIGYSQSVELLLDVARRLPARHRARQRRGRRRATRWRSRPPGWRTCASPATSPRSASPELLATGDVHAVPLRARPGCRERAVQDVLDPRRRAPGRRGDRRRHRDPAPARRVGRRPRRRARRPGGVRRRRAPRSLDDPDAARGDGPARPGLGRRRGVARRPSPRRTRRSSGRSAATGARASRSSRRRGRGHPRPLGPHRALDRPDARRRPRRRLRHPAAPAHQHGAQVDAADRPRAPVVRHIGQLERGGVDHVTLALGFLPEPFVAAFPDGRCGGVRSTTPSSPSRSTPPAPSASPPTTPASTRRSSSTNGDVLTDLSSPTSSPPTAPRTPRRRSTSSVSTTRRRSASSSGTPSGRILRFVEKPAPGTEPSNLINAGTYVLEPSVLARIPLGRRVVDRARHVPAVAADGRFHSLATDDYWIDAGRPELYRQANLDLVNGRRAEVVRGRSPRAPTSPPTPIVDRQRRRPRRRVGAGARRHAARSCCPAADIGAGAVVEDSIVAGAVGRDAVLVRTVVGADAKISDGEHLRDARVPEPVD